MTTQQAQSGPTPLLADYQLRLPAFEGPLDVLLRLIERNRLPIEDVSLVAISDQFLAYARGMDQTRPAIVAEFAAIGARLTVLKSRSLLPRPTPDEEEPEPSDLTLRLREYQRVKQRAAHLDEVHRRGMVAHSARGGAVVLPVSGTPPRLASYDVHVLARSLRRRLSVVPRPATFIRQRRVISIREAIDRIAGFLGMRSRIRFSEVTASMRLRTDVATAFLAVLVMIRRGSVAASQDELFGDFRIELGPGDLAVADTGVDDFTN